MKRTRKTRRAARLMCRRCVVHGMLDEARARQVARLLAASRRRAAHAVLVDFLRLVRLDVDRRTALIESATPLPVDVRERLTARLVRTCGAGLRTTFTVNPTLLAGIRIKAGSRIFDGSVRARLAALEARL